jgi:hypothetical protein
MVVEFNDDGGLSVYEQRSSVRVHLGRVLNKFGILEEHIDESVRCPLKSVDEDGMLLFDLEPLIEHAFYVCSGCGKKYKNQPSFMRHQNECDDYNGITNA